MSSTQPILTLNQAEHHVRLNIPRIHDSELDSSADSHQVEHLGYGDTNNVAVQPTENLHWTSAGIPGTAGERPYLISHPGLNQGQSGSGINLLESFGIPSTGDLPQESQAAGDSRFESFTWYPPLSWDELPDIEEEISTSLRVETEIEKPGRPNLTLRRLPNLDPEAEVFSTGHFEDLGNDENWMEYIYGFPQMMLKAGTYPPFVHPSVYRCSEGEVTVPLAVAFCCLGSYNAAMRSSEKFAYSMINQEREKLIKDFVC